MVVEYLSLKKENRTPMLQQHKQADAGQKALTRPQGVWLPGAVAVSMKTIAVALLALFAIGFLVGCGGSPQTQGGVINLSLWNPAQTGLAADQQAKLIADFNRQHPNIKVTVRGIPFDNYDTASVA